VTLVSTTLSGPPDSLSGAPDTMTLYSQPGCRPLATVAHAFGHQLDIQGTGKLKDGRVVNTSGTCSCKHSPCYFEVDDAWGMGPGGRLIPFRSVAIDTKVIPLGKVLYIPQLDGMQMPGKAPWGGFVHDGCVVAADRGGGIQGHELDFFVGKKVFSDAIYHRYKTEHITVMDGKGWCEKKDGKVVRSPHRGGA
jgi:3D (Asp-Asp-Asp) domain-containing protein